MIRNFLIIVLVFFAASCRNEPVRREYQEVVIRPSSSKTSLPAGHPAINSDMSDPSMKAMIADSVVSAPVKWQTPDGWKEQGSDGMRLATITSPDESAVMSVSSFGGSAGGVEGNVLRWLGQLKIELDDQALKDFIERSETVVSLGGLRVRIFRFTTLTGTDDPSMIAAMTEVNGSTLFVKMTGTSQNLETYFSEFHDFCQSIELK